MTYKIGDPIVADPTSSEHTDVIHKNVTDRTIPESPDGTIHPYSWLITEMDVRIKNESKKALVSVATVLKNEGKAVRYNEFGLIGLVGGHPVQNALSRPHHLLPVVRQRQG